MDPDIFVGFHHGLPFLFGILIFSHNVHYSNQLLDNPMIDLTSD
jgi:hypothetical protein